MAAIVYRSILIVVFMFCVFGDEIEVEVQSGAILKMLREMVNQTGMDTLNLPANSTSIRENITDTFSCENRTYGYYADVDNDCQIFHICLPTQTPSGRNVTYKYSYICPKGTVFNQKDGACVWKSASIPCEDSPKYFRDINKFNTNISETANAKQDTNEKKLESLPMKKNNLVKETLKKEQNEQSKETSKEIGAATVTDLKTKKQGSPKKGVQFDYSNIIFPNEEFETDTSETTTTEDFDFEFRFRKSKR